MTRTMTRLAGLLALATTLASTEARAAEWTLLPGPASAGVAVYIDGETQQNKHNVVLGFVIGNPVRAWFVTDYEGPQRWLVHDILSAKHYIEFNCRNATMRMLSRLYYKDHMGQGRVVASETESSRFTPVVPGYPEEAMYQALCVKAEASTAAAPGPAAEKVGP